ncbi:hypothetical protein GGI25_004898 [Coemansia spiralis]|uniref:Transcription factor TFIIB cyclin-like domain-containing protein n=2 Tax=Coemansia TaxID=4863 RepID=A0A9W8FZK2_9FUNG|nr:hypothetical protein BX070DRAFT_249311 [Coemansia spiralis]KAJ1990825.1 hypothetical protein EDC05_003805 [Coemansia umbellata]KAJ2622611.1 hypothetical protein GGI26_003057 [Coemansia sp. RSA 1358]KAJ2672917.1 hypothetical protein GGI25_004898 [Coemansia spiralis]
MGEEDTRRMQVTSLLNPLPEQSSSSALSLPRGNGGNTPAMRKHQSASTSQESYFPPLNSFSFSASNLVATPGRSEPATYKISTPGTNSNSFSIVNDKESFEMALWRQESGLGPPKHPVLGGSRLECLETLRDPPTISIVNRSQSPASLSSSSSSSPYYNALMRQHRQGAARQPNNTSDPLNHICRGPNGKAGGKAPASSVRQRKQGYRDSHGATERSRSDVDLQIFVPRQPIIGHSAMSADRPGDFIHPLPNDDLGSPSTHFDEGFISNAALSHIASMLPGRLPPIPTPLSASHTMPLQRSSQPNTILPSLQSATFAYGSYSSVTNSSPCNTDNTKEVAMDGFASSSPVKCLRADNIKVSDDEARENSDNSNSPSTSSLETAYGSNAVCVDSALTSSSSDTLLACASLSVSTEFRLEASTEAISIPRLKPRRITSRRKVSPASTSSSLLDAENEQDIQQPSPETKDETADLASCRNKGGAPLFDWQRLEVPEAIWDEAQELYDKVKVMKKVQNRQPICKRHAILAALMFILCRNNGYPRTFAELCTAGKVTKREIGMYYKLMTQVLGSEYTSKPMAKPSEFLQRWCTVLELPSWIAAAATQVYDRADAMAIVQGKCPISVSAASLWLVIWCYNHRHGLKQMEFKVPSDTSVSSSALPNMQSLNASRHTIDCDQRDVCKAASVVIATLTSVFKLLLPHLNTLVGNILNEHL